MPEDNVPNRCPLCQGTNVRIDGWAVMDVRVQFGSRWTGPGNSGYGLNCFACMDCGFVGHYLGPKDLQDLQSVPISTQGPVRSSSKGCAGGILLLVTLVLGSIVLGRWLVS